MNRKRLIFVSATIVAIITCALAEQPDDSLVDSKIDPALAERMQHGSGKIPIIVIFGEGGGADPGSMDVKCSFSLIHGLAGMADSESIKRLAKNGHVCGIYFDGSVHLSFPGALTSGNESVSASRYIHAEGLWERGVDGRGVTVAIIDSGIDKDHPDLAGRVIGEKNFVADETTTDDLLGHGTMVAGIVAGSGAASDGRYRGVAPGASLLNVKVIDSSGDGRVSDIISGIEWAIYNGADVLSLSLGGINLGETNPPITMAADKAADAGVVVCVAAGNRNSTDTSGQSVGSLAAQADGPGSRVEVSQRSGSSKKDVYFLLVPIVLALPPGLIDSPGDGVSVITLGASDYQGHIAGFSGSGPTRDDRIKPDVVAPGVGIISTIPPGLKKPDYIDEHYARESGTSLSTPVAAGLAALLLQEGKLTPAGVKAAMASGAVKLNNTLGEQYEEYYQGAGQIDALGSYQSLDRDVCAVIPDRWIAGRWAYLPAGQGVYVGLDTGADRPQKKIYALAPGDSDWNTRFIFVSNDRKDDLSVSVLGSLSGWVSIQALPARVPANSQEVFAASLTIPEGTPPGVYNGSIEIAEAGGKILSIPVQAVVAGLLDMTSGTSRRTGTLTENQWDYYYLDIPPGAASLKADLGWQSNSSLDLFLLSPTSEYYAGEQENLQRRILIEDPPSGKWLVAVHSQKASNPESYVLRVESDQVTTYPRRWNVDFARPGTNASIDVRLSNTGLPLLNLTYEPVIENATVQEYQGRVGYKETWNKTLNITSKTRKISAQLHIPEADNKSEVALVLETPRGIAKEENAALGSSTVGPVEISNPEVGNWTIKVYGYDVPLEGQSFTVSLKEYTEVPWTWIDARGPRMLGSNSNGTLVANLTIPADVNLARVQGLIRISSDNQTLQVPVSVGIRNAGLDGLDRAVAKDADRDGRFEALDLGFVVNLSVPGFFRLQGTLEGCNGEEIGQFESGTFLQKSGEINVTLNGSDVWRRGECEPLMVDNLILYDQDGNFIERYGKAITIELDPAKFQPPDAYLTGEYINMTTGEKIAVGVNVSVFKPGDYTLSGRIVDDDGEDLGERSTKGSLLPGNATLVLDFAPARFISADERSKLHLVDLVLAGNGTALETRDEAWSSGVMDSEDFAAGDSNRSGSFAVGKSSSNLSEREGTLRLENGKVVIR